MKLVPVHSKVPHHLDVEVKDGLYIYTFSFVNPPKHLLSTKP